MLGKALEVNEVAAPLDSEVMPRADEEVPANRIAKRRFDGEERRCIGAQVRRCDGYTQIGVLSCCAIVNGAELFISGRIHHMLRMSRVNRLLGSPKLVVDIVHELVLGVSVEARSRFVQQDNDGVIRVLILAERREEREEPLEAGRSGIEVRLNVAVPSVPQFYLEEPIGHFVAIRRLLLHDAVVCIEDDRKVRVLLPIGEYSAAQVDARRLEFGLPAVVIVVQEVLG